MNVELIIIKQGEHLFGLLVGQVGMVVTRRGSDLRWQPYPQHSTLPAWLPTHQVLLDGHPLSVLALGPRLGLPQREAVNKGQLLYAHLGAWPVVLAVDEVHGFVQATAAQLKPVPGWLNLSGRRLVWACYLSSVGEVIPLLDLDQLLSYPEQALLAWQQSQLQEVTR